MKMLGPIIGILPILAFLIFVLFQLFEAYIRKQTFMAEGKKRCSREEQIDKSDKEKQNINTGHWRTQLNGSEPEALEIDYAAI